MQSFNFPFCKFLKKNFMYGFHCIFIVFPLLFFNVKRIIYRGNYILYIKLYIFSFLSNLLTFLNDLLYKIVLKLPSH